LTVLATSTQGGLVSEAATAVMTVVVVAADAVAVGAEDEGDGGTSSWWVGLLVGLLLLCCCVGCFLRYYCNGGCCEGQPEGDGAVESHTTTDFVNPIATNAQYAACLAGQPTGGSDGGGGGGVESVRASNAGYHVDGGREGAYDNIGEPSAAGGAGLDGVSNPVYGTGAGAPTAAAGLGGLSNPVYGTAAACGGPVGPTLGEDVVDYDGMDPKQYMHGAISRTTAELLLSGSGKGDGAFLVRPKGTTNYALSAVVRGKVRHRLLEKSPKTAKFVVDSKHRDHRGGKWGNTLRPVVKPCSFQF
jgi:hypothetical protein